MPCFKCGLVFNKVESGKIQEAGVRLYCKFIEASVHGEPEVVVNVHPLTHMLQL